MINKTVTLLERFRNKAGCRHTEAQADKVISELKELLVERDYNNLNVSYSHFKLGEGVSELYDLCKKLKEKYNI